MAFGFGESARAHEATAFWPSVTAAYIWFESGMFFWVITSGILAFFGGWMYIFMRRFRQARRKSESPSNTTEGPRKEDRDNASNLENKLEEIAHPLEIAVPGNKLGAGLTFLSLVVIILSFLALWVYTSYLVLIGSVDTYYFFALALLPWLFISVVIASYCGSWNSNLDLDM